MVRWRFALFLAMLLLINVSCSEDQDEENQEGEEDDGDDKEDDDDEATPHYARRAPTSTAAARATRTKKRPQECYICKYRKDAPLQSCLDPAKFNVNTETCHNTNEKCFTAVETLDAHESEILSVTRGCRSNCVGTPDVTCCEGNRCNSQQFLLPIVQEVKQMENKSLKSIHHTILYFVTILLLLQTVVKVNIL